ncbi:MAG TPA: SRPBCC domain-containing protein [Rhizomicrobium sp.]|nr:SRPBCC domain-containing protein [Rhizomicrobium sp.]
MIDRRTFAATTVLAGVGLSASAFAQTPEISNGSAAIHQDVVLAAPPARIYAALTDAALFDKIVRSSGAMNSAMKSQLGTTPTAIDARPGGAFALFGGYVTGFNLEMLSGKRLVQAWRAGSWDPGLFSIADFALSPHGTGTRIAFDHRGFPNDAAAHLAKGWHANYWEPMARVIV